MRQPLIYNRERKDVDRALYLRNKALTSGLTIEEQDEWRAGLRGALNVSDLERIEDWVDVVNDTLRSYGYDVPDRVRNNWGNSSTLYKSKIDSLRNHISSLHTAFFDVPDWGNIHNSNTMSFSNLNILEWDLQQLYDWSQRINAVPVYSGELYAGEV